MTTPNGVIELTIDYLFMFSFLNIASIFCNSKLLVII